MGVCIQFRALARAACLAVLLAGACTAQLSATNTYKAPSGETVKFVGDSVSLKYFPAPSANCSQCHVAFKLGAVSELDAVRWKATSLRQQRCLIVSLPEFLA